MFRFQLTIHTETSNTVIIRFHTHCLILIWWMLILHSLPVYHVLIMVIPPVCNTIAVMLAAQTFQITQCFQLNCLQKNLSIISSGQRLCIDKTNSIGFFLRLAVKYAVCQGLFDLKRHRETQNFRAPKTED